MSTKTFNAQQILAIEAPLTECVIVAGAGTGKTTVLIERILHLIEDKKIDPNRIWIITFTNKAINEIKKRIGSEIPDNIPQYISTFHGSFLWMLKEHIGVLNKGNNFSVVERGAQIKIIAKIANKLSIIDMPGKLLDVITKIKLDIFPDGKITHEKFIEHTKASGCAISYTDLCDLYKTYLEVMDKENKLDFDDLTIYAKEILKHPEVASVLRKKFDAILIDEFQDINQMQFDIVRSILGNNRNIFCVGDPDQSIYGFRGAKPGIFDEFLKIYKDTKLIKLEENFRSTKKILAVANHLINQNISLFSKVLFTKNEEGEDIKYFAAKTEQEEVEWVIKNIKELVEKKNAKLNDFAILYRNNYLITHLEKAFVAKGIAFKTFNSIKFYERVEIKTIIHFLNLLFKEDVIATEELLGILDLSIGKATITKLNDLASKSQKNLYQIIFNDEITSFEGLTASKVNGVKQFKKIIEDIKALPRDNIPALFQKIMEISGYEKILKDKQEEGKKKINNIQTFAFSLEEEILKSKPKKSLEEVVNGMVVAALDIEEENKVSALNLTTIHNSKGLEFEYVFVIKLVEQVFPSYHAIKNKEIEEERRLAYVAFTRAKKRLFLSSSPQLNFQQISKSHSKESRFVTEIKNIPEFYEERPSFSYSFNRK